MKSIILACMLLYMQVPAKAQKQATMEDTAVRCFEDIKIATKKGAKLWDRNLYGPVLLVDPVTRRLYSNFPDTAGILRPKGKIFYGRLPAEINMANTSLSWNGRHWAMLMLPIPANKKDRVNLLAHELFHRVQSALGLSILNTDNNHLDKKEGRVYLRLELEALKKAVSAGSPGTATSFLTDALTFRKYRHSLYTGSDSTENNLELNEGLAEFTGLLMSGRNREECILHFNENISSFLLNPTFVRSFAYQTTPVYGYLLHQRHPYWNKTVKKTTHLTDLFIKEFGILLSRNLAEAVNMMAKKYELQAIMAEETAREEKINELIKTYKHAFIEAPHVEIPLEQMNISFNPGNIMPVEDKGTYYPDLRITDKWGILTAKNGALISPGWDKVFLTIPEKNEENTISGNGWLLQLKEGYTLVQEGVQYKIIKK